MTAHRITQNDFSDCYMLYYGAGSMGDFLASLIIYSFNEKFNKPFAYNKPDCFYYEPWSKKWVVKDSSMDKFRDYLIRRRSGPPIEKEITLDELAQEFQIPVEAIQSDSEMLSLLPKIIPQEKSNKIPFLFVSENLGLYFRKDIPAQKIPNINFIDSKIADKKYYPLYFLLPLYKHSLCHDKFNRPKFITKENFISDAMKILGKVNEDRLQGRNRVIKDKILQTRNYYEFDIMKLLLNYDPQQLDFLITDTAASRNMIDVARKDMLEILEFFDLTLSDLESFDIRQLDYIYNRASTL